MKASTADDLAFFSVALTRMADLYLPGVSIESFGVKQWLGFCAWLAHNNVLMSFIPRLRRTAPVPVVRKLEEAAQVHEHAMYRRVDALKRFTEAAEFEHLPFVLIKGMALSQELYGNAFARQSGDIDILVDYDDIPKADYVLRKAGWVCPGEAHKIRRMVNSGVSASEALTASQVAYPHRSSRFLPHVTNYFYRHNNGQIDTLELHDRFYALSSKQCSALLAAPRLLDIASCKVAALSKSAHMLLMMLSLHEDVESVHANVTGRPSNGLKGALDAAVWLNSASADELTELYELAATLCVRSHVLLAASICDAVFPGTAAQRFLSFEKPKSVWSAPFELRMLNPVAAAESGAKDALEALTIACEHGNLNAAFLLKGEWGVVPVFAEGISIASGFFFRALSDGKRVSMSWRVPATLAASKNDLALMVALIGREATGRMKAVVVDAACYEDSWKAHEVEAGPGRIDIHAGIVRGGQALEVNDMPDGAGGMKVELLLEVDFAAAFAVPSVHTRVYGSLYRELAGMTLVESVQSVMGF